MQIVPEMDTLMNIGGSGNTEKGNAAAEEGFMGVLVNMQNKFAQMLKEDPEAILAEMKHKAVSDSLDENKKSADNLIMTAGWIDYIPGEMNDEASEHCPMVGNDGEDNAEKIMIGGKSGSVYGNIPVSSGKGNPLMTGSSLLRSFGINRNPELVTAETEVTSTDMTEVAGPAKLTEEITKAFKTHMESKGIESTETAVSGEQGAVSGLIRKRTGSEGSVSRDTGLNSFEKTNPERPELIREIRTAYKGMDENGAEKGNSGANRTVIRNSGRFTSGLVRELNNLRFEGQTDSQTGEVGNNTSDKEVIQKIADYVLKETIKPEPMKVDESIFENTGRQVREMPEPINVLRTELNSISDKIEITASEGNTATGNSDVVRQLVEKINIHRLEDGSSINVKLRPDSLGSISVSLEMTSRGLSATIAATNPDVQNALAGNLNQLAAVLAEYGISQDRIDVVPGEGYYGEQNSNGFMFDDGSSNAGQFGRQGGNRHIADTVEEDSTEVRKTGKGLSIIDMYG